MSVHMVPNLAVAQHIFIWDMIPSKSLDRDQISKMLIAVLVPSVTCTLILIVSIALLHLTMVVDALDQLLIL
jgi:hypothetical protein